LPLWSLLLCSDTGILADGSGAEGRNSSKGKAENWRTADFAYLLLACQEEFS
jgi:hypothetical protein